MRALALLGLLCCATISCDTIVGLRHHVLVLETRGGLAAVVDPPPLSSHPTYAFAWPADDRGVTRSVGVQRVQRDGLAAFELKLGKTYNIGVFTDENGNDAYDNGEPAAVLRDLRPSSISDPKIFPTTHGIRLTRSQRIPAGTSFRIPAENRQLGGVANFSIGLVAELDDPIFAEARQQTGLWRPLDFLREDHAGIYFAEPYDPARVPVLLVHGIGGGSRDWRPVLGAIDRRKYQVWYCMYPSGVRLERVAAAMTNALLVLQQRHGFRRCAIVAHSMGGLVARRLIQHMAATPAGNLVPVFVSISTPWGGHDAALSGIRHLKYPVPSWLDVAPGSDYLAKLYATPLPRGTRHTLLYGSIDGGPFYLTGANDGVVTVASETDRRASRGAARVVHLPYGHMEILAQAETLRELTGALGAPAAR